MDIDRLHDANLIGINWLRDRLVLTFVLPDDSAVIAQMLGVRSLRVDELHEGNIVSDAIIFTHNNCNQQLSALREWVEYLVIGGKVSNDGAGSALNRKSVDTAIRSVIDGDTQLFCLTPAYGCTLACLHEGGFTFGKQTKTNPEYIK